MFENTEVPTSADPLVELELKIRALCRMAESGELTDGLPAEGDHLYHFDEAMKRMDLNSTINRIVVGGINGVMSSIQERSRAIYQNMVEQSRLIPDPEQILAMGVPIPQPIRLIVSHDEPEPQPVTRHYYMSADFLRNPIDYIKFLHLGIPTPPRVNGS